MDGLSLIFFIAVFIIYIVIAHYTGKIADQKGYSYGGFFLFSLIVPLIALLIASFLGISSDSDNNRKCPFCAEYVKKEAIICKHCKKNLPEVNIEEDKEINDSTYKKDDKKLSGIVIFIIILCVFVFIAFLTYFSLSKQNRLSKPDRVKECIEQRIEFFKSVNSYPILNYSRDKGRPAQIVAQEQCNRKNS